MQKIISFIIYCAVALVVKSSSIDSLITDFDARGRYQDANAFFEQIYRGGLLTEPLKVTASTPVDSVRQQRWYWAAEYYYATANYENRPCH